MSMSSLEGFRIDPNVTNIAFIIAFIIQFDYRLKNINSRIKMWSNCVEYWKVNDAFGIGFAERRQMSIKIDDLFSWNWFGANFSISRSPVSQVTQLPLPLIYLTPRQRRRFFGQTTALTFGTQVVINENVLICLNKHLLFRSKNPRFQRITNVFEAKEGIKIYNQLSVNWKTDLLRVSRQHRNRC